MMLCLLRLVPPLVEARNRSEVLPLRFEETYRVQVFAGSASMKLGKSSKIQLFFQSSVDDAQQLASERDDCLTRATASLGSFVELLQIRAVALRDQGTLYQSRAT